MTSAIYYASEGFNIEKNKIMGRQVAGNSFLKAYFKYSKYSEFWVYSNNKLEADNFARFARSQGRNEDIKFIDFNNTGALREAGILFYPGPDISIQSKNRSFFKDNSWSICGITHTTSSAKVMESIQSLVTSPVNYWDAVICTSQAVRSNVLKIIEIEEENLRKKLNASNFVRPQLPVIPLGIDASEFQFTKEQKSIAKEEFLIENDEVVVLYVGRLSFHAKANPYQMYKSLEEAAKRSNRKIVLIECGWYGNQTIKDAFIQASKYLCPNIRILRVDGSNTALKFQSFAAADIFCSLSDNIQETFGITPIEAMAAGLPVIVSDWNGYKDTVRDGIDGFRIPTLMPQSGFGLDLAIRYALDIDNYDMYIGNISNFVSVNFGALSNAFYELIVNKKLRIDMGKNAKKNVLKKFDWNSVILQYHQLWDDLRAARINSNYQNYKWSARLDPFLAFSSYPTSALSEESHIKLVETNIDLTYKKVKEIKNLNIINFSNYTVPDDNYITKIIERIKDNEITIRTLQKDLKDVNNIYLIRSLLWLNKLNIIEIQVNI